MAAAVLVQVLKEGPGGEPGTVLYVLYHSTLWPNSYSIDQCYLCCLTSLIDKHSVGLSSVGLNNIIIDNYTIFSITYLVKQKHVSIQGLIAFTCDWTSQSTGSRS